jgi:hypothetical protein
MKWWVGRRHGHICWCSVCGKQSTVGKRCGEDTDHFIGPLSNLSIARKFSRDDPWPVVDLSILNPKLKRPNLQVYHLPKFLFVFPRDFGLKECWLLNDWASGQHFVLLSNPRATRNIGHCPIINYVVSKRFHSAKRTKQDHFWTMTWLDLSHSCSLK